jgi:hypothetical protein
MCFVCEPNTNQGFILELRSQFPDLTDAEAIEAWNTTADKITLAIGGDYARTVAGCILNGHEGRCIARRVVWPRDIPSQAQASFMINIVSDTKFASKVQNYISQAKR